MDLLYNKPSPVDVLIHEGIRGMTWGERNGPPYPLSRKQASLAEKKAGFKESKFATKNDGNTKKMQARNSSVMSNEELLKGVERMTLEKRYNTLYDELYVKKSKKAISNASKIFVKDLLKQNINSATKQLVNESIKIAINAITD